jgi:hypothetical protein
MDIQLNRNTDDLLTFQYFDEDGVTKRSLVDCTVYFTVKTKPYDSTDDSDAILKKDVTEHTDAANGLTSFSLTREETNITPFNYFYDIKVKESDDKVYLAQKGRCLVDGNLTNRT